MFCKNCGFNMADGEVFCPECGTKQDVEEQAVVNNPVPETAPAADSVPADVKKGGSKKFIVIGIVVAVIIAIVAAIAALSGGGSKEADFVLFRKDGDLYINYLSDNTVKKLAKESGYDTVYSESTGYLFFGDKYDDDDSFTLYYTDTTEKKAEKRTIEKIDSNVVDYTLSKDGKSIIYLSKKDVLYVHDFTEKTKIAGDVYDYYYDEEEGIFAYIEREEDDDDEYTYKFFSIDKKNQPKEELVDIEQYRFFDNDTFAFYANDTVYTYADGKLNTIRTSFSVSDEEYMSIVYIDENNNFYYKWSDGDGDLDAKDFITDSKKDSDAKIEKPSYYDSKYWVDPNASYYFYTDLNDQYYKDLQAYYEKDLRDDLRSYLEDEITVDGSSTTLYCYNGKEDVVMASNIESTEEDGGIILFEKMDMNADVKIDIADIAKDIVTEANKDRDEDDYYSYYGSRYDITEAIEEALYSGYTFGAVVDNTVCAVKSFPVADLTDEELEELEVVLDYFEMTVDKDGTALYYTDEYDEEERLGTLYKMDIKSKALGEAKVVAENVYDYSFDSENNLYTFRDTEFDEDGYSASSDLYINDKQIDTDVYATVKRFETGECLYKTEYSAKDSASKLRLFNGKESITVADEVYSVYAMSPDKIFYIDDIDDDEYPAEGTLNLWTGEKNDLIVIDDSVQSVFFPSVIKAK